MDNFTIIYAIVIALIVLGLLAMTMVNWYRCAMAPKDAFIKAHKEYVQRLYEEAAYVKRMKEGKNE